MKTWFRNLAGGIGLGLALCSTAHAGAVTFDFTMKPASISTWDMSNNTHEYGLPGITMFGAPIAVGETLDVQFSFDPAAARRDYAFASSVEYRVPVTWSLILNGKTQSFVTTSGIVTVTDNDTGYDRFEVGGTSSSSLSPSMQFMMTDSTQSIFNSKDLNQALAQPISLATFNSAFVVFDWYTSETRDLYASVYGNLTSLTVSTVPEPGELAFFLAGLCLIGYVYRRRLNG